MLAEQRTRALLGPADPARDKAPTVPRLTAHELIARAEAAPQSRRAARPTRRLVLTAGAAAVVAGAGVVVAVRRLSIMEFQPDGRGSGLVLVPIAYEFDTGAEPAGARLRALAAGLVDAPHDGRTGRFLYHRDTIWGDPVMTAANGRYHIAFATETETWRAADGSGRQVTTHLEPQYPDEASRDYWSRNLPARPSGPDVIPLPPGDTPPLPADRGSLAELLKVQYGPVAASKEVMTVYGKYAVPRRTRAEILRILAGVPGFVWRGTVTDRAGRAGVAITGDDREHGAQSLLIFHPRTGDLLAHEHLSLTPPVRLNAYKLIHRTDWTDQPG